VLILCGCAFYMYMPIAAATNPPMNWGYAATKEGFLHAITRGQYEAMKMADPCGQLIATQLWIFIRGLARQYSCILTIFALGSLAVSFAWMAKRFAEDARKYLWLVIVWLAAIPVAVLGIVALRYVFLINPSKGNPDALATFAQNYRPLFLLFWGLALPTLLCMIIALWLYLKQLGRAWMVFVWTAFLVTSLGLIMIINPKVDAQEQEITIKFFAPAHGFFAMLIGYGIAITLVFIKRVWEQMPREVMLMLCVGCLALPYISYQKNWKLCSLNKLDFGYQFGYRMFNPGGGYPDMARDAVLYGGTDPGRFVPTYMILCESFVKPGCRYVSPWLTLDEKSLRDGITMLEKEVKDFTKQSETLDAKTVALESVIADLGQKAGREKSIQTNKEKLATLTKEKTALEEKIGSNTNLIATLQNRIATLGDDTKKEREIENQRMRDFDRRDVYIITQNALADQTYMSYIRDHYDYSRPRVEDGEVAGTITNKVKWQQKVFKAGWTLLDRQNTYPKKPIRIPTAEDSARAFQQFVKDVQEGRGPPNVDLKIEGGKVLVTGAVSVMEINAILSKWIFDWNKEDHDFYVEESYVIQWMYPYLRPAGVIMKIEKEPLPSPQQDPKLWEEIVAKDTAYWDKLVSDFLAREQFQRSLDAQKSFSKMRSAIAGLYQSRGMIEQAKYAYQQAVDLCPKSPEGSFRLAELYMNLRQYDKARDLIERYVRFDPYNGAAKGFLAQIIDLVESDARRLELQRKIQSDQTPVLDDRLELLAVYARLGLQHELRAFGSTLLAATNAPPAYFLELGILFSRIRQIDFAQNALTSYTTHVPRDPHGWIELGWIYLLQGKLNEGYEAWSQAVRLGGDSARNVLRDDPRFQMVWQQGSLPEQFRESFRRLLPNRPTSKTSGLLGR